MKIQELLKAKSELDSQIKQIKRSIYVVEKASTAEGKEKVTVRVFSNNQQCGSYIYPEQINIMLNAQLECMENLIEPISKKLEAIELMLNS